MFHKVFRSIFRELQPGFFGQELRVIYSLVDKARLVMKLASFFVLCFCSLSPLFFGLNCAQNTKGIEMQMNN